jgi:hypothetical protein
MTAQEAREKESNKCRKTTFVGKHQMCQKHDKTITNQYSTHSIYTYKNNKQIKSYFNTSTKITFFQKDL